MHKQNQLRADNDTSAPMPPQLTAFMGIDYDEFKPEMFRAVTVEVYDERHSLHSQGAFPSWDAAVTYAESIADKIFYLSSVDDFKADGGIRSATPPTA